MTALAFRHIWPFRALGSSTTWVWWFHVGTSTDCVLYAEVFHLLSIGINLCIFPWSQWYCQYQTHKDTYKKNNVSFEGLDIITSNSFIQSDSMLVYIFVLVIMSVLTFITEHTSDNVCPDLHDSSILAIISVLTFITVVNILYLSFTDCLL